eukprot:GGOE01019163.1.p1 GENE.GGOE01019163.1~~GGOE01019163.1.p1  ORF type:complete len:669 (+),score=183.01 GGOE01019163.1:287-2008(+)
MAGPMSAGYTLPVTTQGVPGGFGESLQLTSNPFMPPVVVPGSFVSMNAAADASRQPLGELFVDRTSPDSLAPWLLLLEKRAPFVVHEIDPRQKDNFAIPTNPSGVLPMWVDADTSCVWGASTVMRFVCDKHQMSPGSYAVEDFHRKTKTNMAIDWCANVLKPHIHQIVYPEMYDQSGPCSLENVKLVLQKDMKVLSEFFLKDSTFIGGDAPDISDCYICMQLLLLYSTDFPPQNQVRTYLHATADQCDNWNEVTSGLRDYCAMRQKELASWNASGRRWRPSEEDHDVRSSMEAQCRKDATEWRKQMEEEFRRRDQEDVNRREAEDRKWREESKKRRAEMEEQFRKEEEQWRSRLIDNVTRQREEEDRRLTRSIEDKRRELLELDNQLREADFRRRMESERSQDRAVRADPVRTVERDPVRSLDETRSSIRTSPRVTASPGRSRQPHVGVEIKMLDDQATGYRDSVVVVHSVVPNTPAAKAGLKMDDIIDKWNSEPLTSKADWIDNVRNSRIGSIVHLTIIRDGRRMDVPVQIGASARELGGTRKVISKNVVNRMDPRRGRSSSPNRSRSASRR